MKTEAMTIVTQEEIAADIFKLVVKGDLVDQMHEPGQFVHLLPPRRDLLLRRPLGINEINHEKQEFAMIYRVQGDGTRAISELKPGEKLDIMGPLGHGFHLDNLKPGQTVYIIGGGIGVPPLYQLALDLKEKGVTLKHFLGFKTAAEVYYEEAFQDLGETVVATDDGSYGKAGLIMEHLPAAEENLAGVFSCGPTGLLRSVMGRFANLDNVQLSLEARMACGTGACYACICHTPKSALDTVKVCEDGPVFYAKEVIV